MDAHTAAHTATGAESHMVGVGNGERLPFAGMEFVVRASQESTGGSFSIIEEVEPVDAPPHIHTGEDELFFVLEGEHILTVDETEYHVGPGDMVFVPRGTSHAQQRVVPRKGRMLTMFSPAGFEQFFREISRADVSDSLDDETWDRISDEHGVVWVT